MPGLSDYRSCPDRAGALMPDFRSPLEKLHDGLDVMRRHSDHPVDSASADGLRKAYRRLTIKFHPDKNKAPDAEETFKAIGRAWEDVEAWITTSGRLPPPPRPVRVAPRPPPRPVVPQPATGVVEIPVVGANESVEIELGIGGPRVTVRAGRAHGPQVHVRPNDGAVPDFVSREVEEAARRAAAAAMAQARKRARQRVQQPVSEEKRKALEQARQIQERWAREAAERQAAQVPDSPDDWGQAPPADSWTARVRGFARSVDSIGHPVLDQAVQEVAPPWCSGSSGPVEGRFILDGGQVLPAPGNKGRLTGKLDHGGATVSGQFVVKMKSSRVGVVNGVLCSIVDR